jgi:hypothetical protein
MFTESHGVSRSSNRCTAEAARFLWSLAVPSRWQRYDRIFRLPSAAQEDDRGDVESADHHGAAKLSSAEQAVNVCGETGTDLVGAGLSLA